MKHAYLIIYHNEYEVAQLLIKAIDDRRNDIYIHVDKKVSELPSFVVNHANLYFINTRIDVRWGDFTVVEAELELYKEVVKKSDYSYLHLLSGVDMPIKSQDYIHEFFKKNNNREFIGYSQYDYNLEVNRKVRRFHLFPKDFRSNSTLSFFVKKALRFLYIRLQNQFNIQRNNIIDFKKGTQWVSITPEFARFLVSKSKDIRSVYKNTFCADEIYKQTICWDSDFKKNIYNVFDEGLGCMRMIGWKEGRLIDFEEKDFTTLISSNYLFARKFNSKHIQVVHDILKHIS